MMTILAKGPDFGGLISGDWKDWGEALQKLLQQSIDGFGQAAWQLLKGAFGVGGFGAGGSGQTWWLAVIGGKIEVYQGGVYQHTVEYPGMLNVLVIAMIPLLIIFVAIQIVLSVYRASTAGMLRAFAAAVLAIPGTYLVAGLIFMGLKGTDELAQWILEVGKGNTSGDDVGVGGILRLFGLWWDPSANKGAGKIMVDANYEVWAMATANDSYGQAIIPWITALILTLCCLVLMLMMLFRTVVVLVLAMFTPIATFALSWDAAKGIAGKWAGFVVALLLAKPIAASVVKLGITMASMSADWVQMTAGIALVLIAAAMPLVMIALISFMTPSSAHGFEQAAGGMAMAGQRRIYGGMQGAGRRAGNVIAKPARTAGRMVTGNSGRRGVRGFRWMR